MKLSIVIPTLNEQFYIDKLIRSIRAQTLKPYEIIIVDGGSTDKTKKNVLMHKGVKFMQKDKPVGNQRSKGGKIAKGDMLLFLDADVYMDPAFLETSLNEIQHRKLTIACPQYIPYPGSVTINGFYRLFNSIFKLSQKYKPSGAGACIFVTKSVYMSTATFESKYVFDDIVFIRKASKNGNFGMLASQIFVSDRRIRKYGLVPTIITYILLSICFIFEFYRISNYIPYSFGLFHNTKTR